MIESVNNEKVKYWCKLNDKKYQETEKKFLVEGEHLVEEAKKSGHLLEVIALQGTEANYDKVSYVSEAVMKKITSLKNANKIVGVVSYLDSRELRGNVLLLDRIMDPGNLGTIIRSAVAFGIDSIVLGDGTVSVYNPKVVRATEGLLFHLNILTGNLKEAILELKGEDYTIYTTDVHGGNSLYEEKFQKKCAIIMGNEGEGVSLELANLADEKIYIDMGNKVESVNVGVATSIILYELNRK